MKSLILALVVLLSIFVQSNNGQIFFNTSVACPQNDPCNWFDPTIWEGGLVPSSSSSPPDATVNGNGTIIFIYTNQTFQVNHLQLQDVVLTLNAGVSITGSLYTEDVDISFVTQESTIYSIDMINGSVALTNTASLVVTTTSSFSAVSFNGYDNSTTIFNGNATFINLPPPAFQDEAGLTCLALCTFYGGIRVNGTGHVGLTDTYLYTHSQFADISILGEFYINEASSVNVQGFFEASHSTVVIVTEGSTLLINGEPQYVSFNQVQVDVGGSLQIVNVASGVTGQTSYIAGTVLFDNIDGDINFGETTAFANLQLAGSIGDLILNSANIQNISVVESQVPNAQPNIRISANGNVILNNFTTVLNNTIFDVEDGSSLQLNDDVEFSGPGGFRVLGLLEINTATITTESNPDYPGTIGVSLLSEDAVLYTTNSTIDGVLRIGAGTWFPVSTTIIGSVNFQGGFLNFSTTTDQNVNITGDFTMTEDATIYLTDDLVPEDDAIIYVTGNCTIGGIIIVNIDQVQDLAFDKNYYIIESENPISGLFAQATVTASFISSFNYAFELSPGGGYFVQLVFFEPPVPSGGPTGRLAGWKVFLIILAIVVVLGGGIYGYLRYKRNSGYMKVN